MNYQLILILGIFVSLSSCGGQANRQKVNTASTSFVELGKVVSELDPTIWDIHQDRKSNYWFGSKENGVYYYDGQQLRHYSKEDGLVSNQIRGIQEDSLGHIYFETMEGVSKFDGFAFESLEIKRENASNTAWKLKPGDLWFRIGFDNKGPYRYDGKYLHYLEFPASPQEATFYKEQAQVSFSPYGIYKIYKDRSGLMWFGTSGVGLCRFDGQSISWHYEEQLQKTSGGGDFGMRAIFQDKDGYFWFNNSRYRYEVLPNSSVHLDYRKEDGLGYQTKDNTLEFPHFLAIEQDDEGNLWMVTYSDGVWKNDGNQLLNYPVKDGETAVLLFTIYKDKQGVLWLGTHNAGVYKFNGNTFEKFSL